MEGLGQSKDVDRPVGELVGQHGDQPPPQPRPDVDGARRRVVGGDVAAGDPLGQLRVESDSHDLNASWDRWSEG